MVKNINIQATEFEQEMQWLAQLLDQRFKLYFDLEVSPDVIALSEVEPPAFMDESGPYARLIEQYQCGFQERVALALCLAVHLRPQLLDVFFTKNKTFDRPFTEFGGLATNAQGHFQPTGETLLFLLAGSDLSQRLEALQLLDPEQPLFKQHILELVLDQKSDSRKSGQLKLSRETQAQLIQGRPFRPDFSMDFPARRLTTELDWSDLVLPNGTLRQLEEIKMWTEHGHQLLYDWGMRPKLRPGYRSLFYGPPGTGKTMTASLLGKATGREVYRIDLSMIISKYIGETEKNLARVFQQAEYKDWILFFDEADALFGKRTEVQDAHDRYANQEVSYLLQRIEDYAGIVILASNFRENLDSAFTRRFESTIYFPMPGPSERFRLWQAGFPAKAVLDERVDLPRLARQYELAGGSIMNVVRFASLRALANGGVVQWKDVMEGVRKELAKEGKTL